eukprot:NODE_5193_length_525_cov_177.972689_g3843_i0.p1 GENE.NODE_5193_length_525_cov_177.972689_g3843_i0~~NODE_5193_length_525_cov_177.972689_g3843_i0.p1  ORF type:complete len:145 (+),score=42.04 NODE_5193_length_525_cov_177.972689_g3843_i0:26-436(+)
MGADGAEESRSSSFWTKAKDFAVSTLHVGVVIFIVLHSDLITVVLYNSKIYRSVMYVGFFFMSINVGIGLFLVFYVSWWLGRNLEQYHPKAIPVATAAAVVGFVLLTIALWPVYHVMTPVLMFCLLWGVIHFASLL